MFDLIRVFKGGEEVVMTDSLQKVNDRLKTLRQSSRKVRGQRVQFIVRNTTTTEKYRKPPKAIW